MYAVIKTGGKQYRVSEGDTLRVEKLPGDVGSTLTLDEVLMVGGDSPTNDDEARGSIQGDKHPKQVH